MCRYTLGKATTEKKVWISPLVIPAMKCLRGAKPQCLLLGNSLGCCYLGLSLCREVHVCI